MEIQLQNPYRILLPLILWVSRSHRSPNQMLICEIQGYEEKNATVTFSLMLWDMDKAPEIGLELGRLQKSLNVTLPSIRDSVLYAC